MDRTTILWAGSPCQEETVNWWEKEEVMVMASSSAGCPPSHPRCSSTSLQRRNYRGVPCMHLSVFVPQLNPPPGEDTIGKGTSGRCEVGARGVALVHNVLAKSVTPSAAGNKAHQAPIPRRVGSTGASWRVQHIYTCSQHRCGKAKPGSSTPAVFVVTRWSRILTHCFNLIFIV